MVQKATGGFLQKMADEARRAFETHKSDETEYSSFGDVPPGINNGVAQLTKLEFKQVKEGKTNAGQWMFYAEGRVLRPLSVIDPRNKEEVRTEGLLTKLFEPLYDTPDRTRKTFDDHMAQVLNELRKLGLNTASLRWEQLEQGMQALVQAAPYFKFRTYQMPPRPGETREPMVNHAWEGEIRDYQPDGDDGVNDQSSGPQAQPPAPATAPATQARRPAASTNGTTNGPAAKATPQARTGKSQAPQPTPQAGDGQEAFDEFGDVDSLVAAANRNEVEAQDRLKEMAMKAGASDQEIIDAPDWETVGKMAMAGQDDTGEGGPEVGTTVFYRPVNPRTNKPDKRRVECQIIKVDADSRTVDLKSMVDAKTKYTGVPVDQLETAS